MRKLLVLLLLTTYYLLLNPRSVLALNEPLNVIPKTGTGTWYVQPTDIWSQKVFTGNQEELTKERYTLSVLVDMANSVIAAVGGVPTKIAEGPNGPVYSYQGGAISVLAGLTGSLYTNPPASSVEYLADIGNNLGIVKPAYAQGLGFNAFAPVLSLWKTFRDIAYLVLVVIFVVVGFMIMFRKRIDPRTVVTVQEALPKLVVTLIIITFSYAIIGLLVDLIQMMSFLIVNVLVRGSAGKPFLGPTDTNTFLQTNVFNLVWDFYGSVEKLGDSVSSNVKLPTDFILKGMVQITVTVVFTITLFFTMFKIFFMLLGSYVNIVLAVVFSPIQAIMGAFPGNKSPLSWTRDLIANLLVFPATLSMLLIAYQFTAPATTSWQLLSGSVVPQNFTWAPALIGSWTSAGGVGPLLGFGIIMAIPAVGQAVKQALEVKESALGATAEKEIRGGFSGIPIVGGFFR